MIKNATSCLLVHCVGIGDFFSYFFPLAKILRDRGCKVDLWVRSSSCVDIARKSGVFESIKGIEYTSRELNTIRFNTIDPHGPFRTQNRPFGLDYRRKLLSHIQGRVGAVLDAPLDGYDQVVAPFDTFLAKVFRALVPADKLVVPHLFEECQDYRVPCFFREIGVPYEPSLLHINIEDFQADYIDHRCGDRTVLVNLKSTMKDRTYRRDAEVCSLLEKLGFDVRKNDPSKPLTAAIHLINQTPRILCVDTSTLWIARSLRKEPCVIVPQQTRDGVNRLGLACEPLPCPSLNEISPQQIVGRFLEYYPTKEPLML